MSRTMLGRGQRRGREDGRGRSGATARFARRGQVSRLEGKSEKEGERTNRMLEGFGNAWSLRFIDCEEEADEVLGCKYECGQHR